MAGIDIDIDPGAVTAVETLLKNNVDECVDGLSRLLGAVQGLLEVDGGLFMRESNEPMRLQFQAFHDKLAEGINSITDFSANFQSIVGELTKMDGEYADAAKDSS